jgi:hypothetical protein
VLSPFEVKEEQDSGYLAGTVQSGTRLRMELKDAAASISVVTKDFMRDVGANNLEDLLLYTLGTEVGGAAGNFSDAGVIENPGGSEVDYDNAFGSAMPSTRVRGLTAADVARDFFVSSIPPDSYNVERKEISRGANAMLFGLGSPAGIINASLSRAGLQKRKTEVQLQADQYGSYRFSLDHNEPIIRNKLALRFASMYEDNQFRVKEAWEKDKRAYLTATWRPFKTTTVRASYEAAKIKSNRPETRPPVDAYTQWWYLGKPVYNMFTGASTLMGTPAPGWPSVFIAGSNPPAFTGNIISTQIGAMGGGQQQMLLVYNDPTSSRLSLGLPGMPNVGAMRGGTIPNVHLNPAGTRAVSDGPRGLREMNAIYNRAMYVNTPTANYWKATQITDPAIYDFYEHMLHGSDKFEWAKWNTTTPRSSNCSSTAAPASSSRATARSSTTARFSRSTARFPATPFASTSTRTCRAACRIRISAGHSPTPTASSCSSHSTATRRARPVSTISICGRRDRNGSAVSSAVIVSRRTTRGCRTPRSPSRRISISTTVPTTIAP